jgi:hypothetical protein
VQTFQDFSVHVTGFSQWSVTELMSAEFIRRKILEGTSPDAPNFFGSAGALPPRKNHLPVANRHSLPFYDLSCNDDYETE